MVELDRTSVLSTVRWNALSETGALIREFVTSYQLLSVAPGEWRVLSYTYHDD